MTEQPAALYIWLVPSEHVLEQPGSWRIRKWDTEPFPEANFECRPKRPDPLSQALNEGDGSYKP